MLYLPNRIWPLFLSFLLLISCGRKKETTQVRQTTLTEAVYASGIIRSKHQYKVYPAVNGVIQEVRVSEGDIVKKALSCLYSGGNR